MPLFKCPSQSWKFVDCHDNPIQLRDLSQPTTEQSYTFTKPVRNFTFKFYIKGEWNNAGPKVATAQVGYTFSKNGTAFLTNFREWYDATSNHIYEGTYTLTDKQKYKTISTVPWVAVFNGAGDIFPNQRITACDIQILSYEELR